MNSHHHDQKQPVWEMLPLPQDVGQALQDISAVTRAQAIEVIEAWMTGKLPMPKEIDEADLSASIELLRTDDSTNSAEDDDVEAAVPEEGRRMGVLPPEELTTAGRDLLHRHQLGRPVSEPDVMPTQSDDDATDPTTEDPS